MSEHNHNTNESKKDDNTLPAQTEKTTVVQDTKPTTPQPIVVQAKSGGKGIAIGALILAILGLGASGFLFTQGQNVLKTQQLQLQQELDKAALGESQNAVLLQNSVLKQNELGNSIDTLFQVQQRNSKDLENLTRAYQELLKSRVDWVVDEAEVILNAASQQLLLSGNVPVAIRVLESLEQRLSRFEQAELLAIKQAISNDLAALKKQPYLNVPATVLRLNRLESSLSGLPLMVDNTLQAQPNVVEETAQSADFWTQAWDKTLAALRGMVEVRHLENNDAMLLAPEQIYFVRENLRLRLLDARLALMQYNGEVYQNDLSGIEATVKQYFDTRSPTTQTWLQELAQLKALDVRMISDNALTDSQTAIRNYQNAVRTALPIELPEHSASQPASAPIAASQVASDVVSSVASVPAQASEPAASVPAASAVKGTTL